MVSIDERDLTTSQVARQLGVSQSMVRVLITNGSLPAVRTALGHLVRQSDVDKLAEDRRRRREA